MKKIFAITLLLLVCAFGFAQSVTLTFTGRDAYNRYVQLNRVIINSLTHSWQETIVWPDTTLTMQNEIGILENTGTFALALSQNVPNPFNGSTDVCLTLPNGGPVELEVFDVNGKMVAHYAKELPGGTHQFRIQLAVAQAYFLAARCGGQQATIKMLNQGAGALNAIEYQGSFSALTFTLKGTTNNPFSFGDLFEYVGYATINGNEVESARINQPQDSSQNFTLQFDAAIIEDGQPCPGMPAVTDYDGNIYNTVQIGAQCWMKENMRTTHYYNGTAIATSSATSDTTAYYYHANDDSSNDSVYGLLYNWPAAVGSSLTSAFGPQFVQGICPTGWHVPSDAEWMRLAVYVGSQSQYVCGDDTTHVSKALASTNYWPHYTGSSDGYQCFPSYDTYSNNATGFSAVPAGYYGGYYGYFGHLAALWSAREYNDTRARLHRMLYTQPILERARETKYSAFSVRCLRDHDDGNCAILPTVTTNSIYDISANSAMVGGTVVSDGGDDLTARGVCWSTSQNPTIADSCTFTNGGEGSYSCCVFGLFDSTTYFVRAFATNSAGTTYGQQKSFTTPTAIAYNENDGQPCQGSPTLTDYDGNSYNTVQIGTQCWMKENLRTTHYYDGTAIATSSTASANIAYYYHPNADSSNDSVYGLLYNWSAVMRGELSSEDNPSGVQGICPTGWHVPSEEEWNLLLDYVCDQSQYICGHTSHFISKALASTIGWAPNSEFFINYQCTPGYNTSDNNATGFSAVPAGYSYGQCDNWSYSAYFWTATETSSDDVSTYILYSIDSAVEHNIYEKDMGLSLRCVRD
ncbi:MAG: fibrobacter succinogenes major paralogous domain-containing protein [Bacteroidales bacterium]|nr:fibrobacter succinogenes major paralogous domain-containing protein [Bacteroidales bacterium]